MSKVLIRDDQKTVHRRVRQIHPEKFSFPHIDEVADTVSLFNRYLIGDWDFIVSDLAMSGVSGLPVLEQIFQNALQIPVYVLNIYRSRILNKRNNRSNAELIPYAIEDDLI